MEQIQQIWQSLIRWWKKLTADWHIYLEIPVPLEELIHSREQASIPSFGFFFLLTMAAVITTLGLLANSGATIIGAMIIAPLMNPILSMAFGITTGNALLYKRSFFTLTVGSVLTIAIAYFLGKINAVPVAGSEILARTQPTLLDLGIAIAAGAAGAFALTRKSIATSVAGVAIAVALVPPLCVVGIGLWMGQNVTELAPDEGLSVGNTHLALGALLLFLANLAGITFTACLVFLLQSYGTLKASVRGILNWLLIVFILCWPLWNSLHEFVTTNQIRYELFNVRRAARNRLNNILVRNITVTLNDTELDIEIPIAAPPGTITQKSVEALKHDILEDIHIPKVEVVKVKMFVIPLQVIEANAERI